MMSYLLISRALELRLGWLILGIRDVVEFVPFIECLLCVLYVESAKSEPKRLDFGTMNKNKVLIFIKNVFEFIEFLTHW